MQTRETNQISNIDFLRGMAAIAVLVWHYQHFYVGSAMTSDIGAERHIQPLYALFAPFYEHGHLAVQFFWLLSGFGFFHVYRSRRDVTLRQYFAHRFARLYPLHLITLCLVALLQWACLAWLGAFQIYPVNDVKHFVLQLFFASDWGFQDGYSFNGPIWSVSLEVIVYALFFTVLRTFGLGFAVCLVWAVLSWVGARAGTHLLFTCSGLFAFGGLLSLVQSKYLTATLPRSRRALVQGALVLVCVVGVVLVATGRAKPPRTITYVVFPALILLAACLETGGRSFGRFGDGLGSITYSSYLIHVPLQLVAILVMDGLLGSRGVVASPVFLVAYLGVVLGLGLVVYRKVELPLKRLLTTVLDTRPAADAAGVRA